MLEEYLGCCGPIAAYLDVISLNELVSETSDEGGETAIEIVDTLPL